MRINVEDEDITGSHIYDLLTNARRDCQTLRIIKKCCLKFLRNLLLNIFLYFYLIVYYCFNILEYRPECKNYFFIPSGSFEPFTSAANAPSIM